MRTKLRLALAGLWLLDAALQFQPYMFTRGFGESLAATAQGNPGVIAAPVLWSAHLIERYPVPLNALFATVQLLLAVGIAWRRTARPALAASIAWSLAVWWLGEGLGGLFAGMASPLTGAPGGVLLYALLAVLLWPGRPAPAESPAARAAWLVLWVVLAVTAVFPASSGTAGPAILSAALTLVAAGIYLPPRWVRLVLIAAIGLAVYVWWAGEDFGQLFSGQSTDPNSGPPLILLALAYWPSRGKERLQVGRDPVVGAAADHVGGGGEDLGMGVGHGA